MDIKDYFSNLEDDFKVGTFFDPDIEKFENAEYAQPTIYKYYSAARRDFFRRPQVRFTQREWLNDPFEMAQRWKEARTDKLKEIIRRHLQRAMPEMFGDTDFMIAQVKKKLNKDNLALTPAQSLQIETTLRSAAGKAFIEAQLGEVQALIPLVIEYGFSHVESNFERLISETVAKCGILSLSEEPLNQLMWAHYANSGDGFVVGLDAQHRFFRPSKPDVSRRNLLRKIEYTDERAENFWSNPFYLFLVKGLEWAYEREWRMIKDLSECDEQRAIDPQTLCLCNLPADAIKVVYFGYNYDVGNMPVDMASLAAMGCHPSFYRVHVNRRTGLLAPEAIASKA
jgi:Protein of unknown function (DUF2971)